MVIPPPSAPRHRNRSVTILAILAGLVVLVALTLSAGLPAASSNDRFDFGVGIPSGSLTETCGESSGAVAAIGRLAAGHDIAEVSGALPGWEPGLVVLPFGARPDHRALQTAGVIHGHAADPGLCTSEHRLADKPAAAAIAARTTAVLIARGSITRAQLEDPGTTYLLTDDPTEPRHLFFAVVLATPLTFTSPGTLTAVVATLDRATGTILFAGPANWYP